MKSSGPVWADTCIETQIDADELDEESIDSTPREIGSRVSDSEVELFVSCDPVVALQQHLDRMQRPFIALHDVGTKASMPLLQAIATASGQRLQQLRIRRQGYGIVLATLWFVDLPSGGALPLRLFTTQIDADIATRLALSQLLLSNSTLGAMLLGPLATHVLGSEFGNLRRRMASGNWRNRQLLLLPLAALPSLAGASEALSLDTGVTVRDHPPTGRPTELWNAVRAHWARINPPSPPLTRAGGAAPEKALEGSFRLQSMPSPTAAPAATTPLAPAAASASPNASIDSALAPYVSRVAGLSGLLGCCVFDLSSGKVSAGSSANATPLAGHTAVARHGQELLGVVRGMARALALGEGPPEATVSTATHHLLLRGVPGQPKLALAAIFSKTSNNPTLTRAQLLRINSQLDDIGAQGNAEQIPRSLANGASSL